MLVNRASGIAVLSAMLTPATALAAPPTKDQCIAANEAVQYLREAHKLHEAREKLLLCVSEACPGPIRQDCAQRLDEVDKATPSVVFDVKDSAGGDVASATVTMDGQPLAVSVGTAIQVDPGAHTFVFEAQGSRVEKKLVIVEGVKERREAIRLVAAAPAPVTTPASAPPPSKVEEAPKRPGHGPPTLAWAAFGVGAAGLALGIMAGLEATSANSTLQGECNEKTRMCDPQYSGDIDSFHTWRTASTIGYVVGALGIAGGAVLWMTAPKAQTTAARVWFGPASAGVGGTF